jgi:hypothetical protein
LAVLTVIFLWRVVFLGQVMLPVDMLYEVEPWKSESIEVPDDPPWNPNLTDSIWQLYPVMSYAKDARQAGEGYFWDPHLVGGTPAMARGDMFLNPIAVVLSTFLPVAQTLNWLAVIHLFLAGAFTYLLLREMGVTPYGALIGGLAFAYNSYLIAWFALANHHNTEIWLPLILWSIERATRRRDWRWGIVGALGFALQIVSGFILWPFYGGITLILYAVYRSVVIFQEERNLRASTKPILYTGLTLGLGVLLAMPQILPTVQLFLHTDRNISLGAEAALDFKSHLIRFFAPKIFGDGVFGNKYRGPYNYPETTLYFGILALFFIFASLFAQKRKITWGLVGIGAAALLAVYNLTPFREIIATLYPLFLNTFPGRIFYVVLFTWSIAAGFGADWLARERPPGLIKWLSILALVLSVGFFILWRLALQTASRPASELIHPIEKHLAISDPTSLLTAALILLLIAFIFWGRRQGRANRVIFMIATLALLTGDLFISGIHFNSTFDPKFVFPETPSLEFLSELKKNEETPYRVLNVNSGLILLGMTPGLYDLHTMSGYSSWILSRYSEYTYLTQSRWPSMVHVYFYDCCHRLIDAMNVKYVYTSPDTLLTDLTPTIDLIARFPTAEIDAELPEAVFATTWTFEDQDYPVLYQHPTARATYQILLEKPARLISAIALDPLAWDKPGDGVLFEIHARTENMPDAIVLFSRYLDPKNEPSDRGTIPVAVDLSPYINQNISLSLVTKPGPKDDPAYDWAGWIAPKIENDSPQSPLRLVYDGPNKIYENTEAFPRAWVVHQATQVAPNDIEAIKQYLQDPRHNLALEAVVESEKPIDWIAEAAPETSAPPAKVEFIVYASERVEIEAELEQPGLLVLSDVMYPGWHAYVDGIEKTILTTNLYMRGVHLDQGKHEIVFVYKPDLFTTGVIISIITLLICLGGIITTPIVHKY